MRSKNRFPAASSHQVPLIGRYSVFSASANSEFLEDHMERCYHFCIDCRTEFEHVVPDGSPLDVYWQLCAGCAMKQVSQMITTAARHGHETAQGGIREGRAICRQDAGEATWPLREDG